MTKRIFVCELVQESNSFNPVLSDFDDFNTRGGVIEGEELVHADGRAGVTIEGMLYGVREAGFTPIGGVRIRAKSGGPVDHHVIDWFVDKTVSALQAAGKLDGVLVSLHGATTSDVSEDVCGDILANVRGVVGEAAVIGVSCDLHGNITESMMRNADFICGYQTYPHLDFFEVGHRAATLTIEKINGSPLKMARVTVPMIAPAHGYSTAREPLHTLMEKGHALVRDGKIRDFSIFQAQPWLDVRELASTVLVIAENEEVAKEAAADLAADEFALRRALLGEKLWAISDVIQAALANEKDAPVVLVDSADSPNAGACGDSAAVLEYILPYKDTLRAAVSLNDEAAVEKAFSLGVGGKADFTLGASLAPKLSRPVTIKDAVVRSLHKGDFILGGPAERGQKRSMGRCAVLEVGQLQILLTVRGQNNGDLQFYRSFGIEPTLCRLVCVKACSSFRAGYEPVSALICNTATPGAAGPVLTDLPFTRIPKPLFPFAEITEDTISAPVCYR